MKKIVVFMILISTITFSRVRCKITYAVSEKHINKELSRLQDKGYTIVDIKILYEKGFGSNDVIILYEDNVPFNK